MFLASANTIVTFMFAILTIVWLVALPLLSNELLVIVCSSILFAARTVTIPSWVPGISGSSAIVAVEYLVITLVPMLPLEEATVLVMTFASRMALLEASVKVTIVWFRATPDEWKLLERISWASKNSPPD